jgi:hypothetical protein
MLDAAQAKDLFRGKRIVWQCRAGHYCAGLVHQCPIDIVACMDDSPTHDLVTAATGTVFLSCEKARGRIVDDSALNDLVPAVREELRELLGRPSSRTWVVAAASTTASLRDFAAEAGVAFLANAPELTAWLNDKSHFLDALETLGLPRIRGRWIRLPETRYAELASEMGSPFVVQTARGMSGSGTAFIASEGDCAEASARFGDRPVRAAPDLGDLSLNINALATEENVVVSCPSLQLTGLAMLGARRGMYCGNDFVAAAKLPGRVSTSVVEQTSRIGRWLSSLGFRGLFGLDFVIDQATDRAYAVDLNPRWQGSTTALTLAEAKAGRLPLAAAELAWRLGAIGEADLRRSSSLFLEPVAAAHISLRSGTSGRAVVSGEVRPGVYSSGLVFRKSGFELSDLSTSEELLVTGGVPRPGATMGPGAHVLRVACERQVLDLATLQPLPWCAPTVRGLYQALALVPANTETGAQETSRAPASSGPIPTSAADGSAGP